MATVMDPADFASPTQHPNVSGDENTPADLAPSLNVLAVAELFDSAFTGTQMEQVFATILTWRFGSVEELQQLLQDLNSVAQNSGRIIQAAQDAFSYKEAAEAAQVDATAQKEAAEAAYENALDQKHGAETAMDGALAAKDAAEQAQLDAIAQKNDAITARDESRLARDEAQAAANRAAAAAEQASGAAGVIPVLVGPYTKVLTVSGWQGSGPWTQDVPISGVTANDNHLNVRPVMVTDANYEAYMENYSRLFPCFQTLSGKIRLTCFEEKPTADFLIVVEGIR